MSMWSRPGSSGGQPFVQEQLLAISDLNHALRRAPWFRHQAACGGRGRNDQADGHFQETRRLMIQPPVKTCP